MSFSLIQAGSHLQSINSDGVLSGALSLPTGVSLATNRVPRFARFAQGANRFVVVVNTPTQPLSVDSSGVVRPLTPSAPGNPVTLSAGAAGSLSGTYLAVQTYAILDNLNNIISESNYSPLMASSVSITSKKLTASFASSPEGAVNVSRLYRTTTGPGSEYFFWKSVPNSLTSYSGDESDALIGIVSAPLLGAAPAGLCLICEWGGRLFGVDRNDPDNVRYTESGTMYQWYALNTIPIAPIGDGTGITGFIPRRNSLGVGRKNAFTIVNGTSRTNFTATRQGLEIGLVSQESVVVYKDTAFFLWRDGVYTWDNDGFKCISDGRTRSWFTSDQYFNRAMFWRAVGAFDPVGTMYRLYLASPGSAVLDRWIEYDLTNGTWWGPHKTDAFTITSAFAVYGANQQPYTVIGSQEGFLSLDQEPRNDWELTPINMQATTKVHDMLTPDQHKHWGELEVYGEKQSAGTMDVTASLGHDPDSLVATPAMEMDLTNGRQRLGRVGAGEQMQLEFANSELNVDVTIRGYDIDPVHATGRR